MPHPVESLPRMLHVYLVSGEKLTSLPTEGLADVRALKRHLQKCCGTPRFRQRLLHDGRHLADDVKLCYLATDIQLVLLPFVSLSVDESHALRNAVWDGQVRVVEDMLLMPADPNDSSFSGPGRSLLRSAAYFGHEEIARLLLEAGSTLVLGSGVCTPLCAACYSGHVEMVSLLLGAGAEKDAIGDQGTPLTWAVGGTGDCDNRVRIVKELLEARADLNKVDGALHTPLTCAMMYCCEDEMVQALLNASASTDVICPGSQQSPLCFASTEGSLQQVCMLLDAGADKDKISARRTPLTSAVGAGHMKVVQVLTKAGASLDMVDDEQYTPLTRALWSDNVDILRVLLAARANANMVCPHSKQTPLCAASATGRVEIVRQLLLTGAALNRKCAGRTALASAACEGHVEVVRLLIIAGATLDSLDRRRYTPLDRASHNGHEEVVRLLVVAKACASWQ